MGAKKPAKKRAETKAEGDDPVMRLGTAQDWREAVAKKTTKNAASAPGRSSSQKRKAEKMRDGSSRD